ncbi:MAG: ester cyclase [Candidatus Marinimicrobia bacterium]|nr:ester cyclase [Candidatus Neomarinimicrobiota bacterium]MCF7829770.1 ester cyclase [Candidatus Neomarinimicrobiota bacterium]MCF7881720.1 ester cyclase [Candidatus Neomarinimicrobiota bacterium]
MINRSKRTLQHQLNTWIVARFIDEIYNRNNLSNLPEFVAHDCQYCGDPTVIGEDLYELQMHFAYTWINQQAVFEEVQYEVEEVISQHDIVSVKVRRKGKAKSTIRTVRDLSRWEMFQLHEGKIARRWIANA